MELVVAELAVVWVLETEQAAVAKELVELGIPAIALFPSPNDSVKSETGDEAFNSQGLVQTAVRELKALQKSMMLTPCCPKAGPRGGDGLALPASTCSFI